MKQRKGLKVQVKLTLEHNYMPCYHGGEAEKLSFEDTILRVETIYEAATDKVDILTDMLCNVGKVLVYNDKQQSLGLKDRKPIPAYIVSWFKNHKLFDEQRGEPWV